MSPAEDEQPPEGDAAPATRRRRGTRGGRGRKTASSREGQAREGQSTSEQERGDGTDRLNDPRVVRRRPATPRKAAEEAPAAAEESKAGESEQEEKPRSRRAPRRRAAAKPAEAQPAEAAAEAAGNEAVADEAETEKPPTTRRRGTRTAKTAEAPSADVVALVERVDALRETLETLTVRIEEASRRQRLGVFVDVPNVIYGAERDENPVGPINMGKLLDYLSKGRELVRATAYAPVSDDPSEPVERQRFVAPFVPYPYRIVTKPLKRFADGSIKGNFDVELAVDMVMMAERLDVITLVSGDADFARAVELIQGRGVRVEIAAFAGSTAVEMRAIADRFIELGSIVEELR